MTEKRLKNAQEIINYAKNNGISVSEACGKFGYSSTYVKNIIQDILAKDEGVISEECFDLVKKYNEYINSFKKITIHNTDIDEKYDERSKSWVNRDENGKINKYCYEILIRDEHPFKGELSRLQMENIYAYYPYVTQNTVSQFFPYLNTNQLKRILRVFNITKDKLFPPHLTEELSDDQLAELALKNKENSAYKKIIENKNKFYEQELRKTQQKLFDVEEDTKYLENIIDKTLLKYIRHIPIEVSLMGNKIPRKESEIIHDTLFFAFGDIHFGKYFNDVIYGRGVNKVILKERCLKIAQDVVFQANLYKSKKIYLNVMGDIFESILPDGMHSEHHKRMDLIGEEQIQFGIEVFEEMIDYIVKNCNYDINLYIYCIGGNHDRILANRDQDKRRTASAIFFIMLSKIVKLKQYNNVHVKEAEDGILKYADNDISVIAFHGDNKLFNSPPVEIMNLFKTGKAENYTVILNGHWHSVKLMEGLNYKRIICGSVCSVDDFIQNEIGKGSQPSYVVFKKSEGYGVDVEIKTLY